jgi:hypothetical protein
LAEVTGLGVFDDVKRYSITVEVFDRQIATLDLSRAHSGEAGRGREKDLSTLAELESLLEAGEP